MSHRCLARLSTMISAFAFAYCLAAATPAFAADCSPELSRTRAVFDTMHKACTTAKCATVLPVTATARPDCPADVLAPVRSALRAADRATSTIVLLGEVHDNPHHHEIRAALIGDAANLSLAPVVEHLPAPLQATIDNFRRDVSALDVSTFFDAVGWTKLGWPDAAKFAPLYSVLLRQRPAIVAADVPKDRIRKLARNEPGAIDAGERARLRLDDPFPPELQETLLVELEASHCGMMPKAAFTGMAASQNYRDAHIAAAAIEAARTHGTAVVIAGNGHVRSDRAVPFYIRKFAPGIRILSVGFIEEGQLVATEAPLYDFAVVTPRAMRPDPCEEMRKRARPKQ